MRCVEVIESLATSPTLAPAELPPAVAAHLEVCPHCADRAARDARLVRLWEATRAEEPPPAAWTTLWSQVTSALEATPATPSTLSFSSPQVAHLAGSQAW